MTNKMKQTLEEAAEKYYPPYPDGIITDEIRALREGFIKGCIVGAERMYSEEDMSKAYFQGWATRERYDDMVPDIIYPKGLDYEEQQDYAFNLWFEQFKKK